MRDSSTYQAILEDGRVEEARDWLLDLGARRFGPPAVVTSATLAAIEDHDRLHALAARLFDASAWADLFRDS